MNIAGLQTLKLYFTTLYNKVLDYFVEIKSPSSQGKLSVLQEA